MAQLTPLTPAAAQAKSLPSDSLMLGVHSTIGAGSKHKKQVSGILHLKRESVGKAQHPTSFSGHEGAIAFPKKRGGVKVG